MELQRNTDLPSVFGTSFKVSMFGTGGTDEELYRAAMKAMIQKIGYDYDIDIVDLRFREIISIW